MNEVYAWNVSFFLALASAVLVSSYFIMDASVKNLVNLYTTTYIFVFLLLLCWSRLSIGNASEGARSINRRRSNADGLVSDGRPTAGEFLVNHFMCTISVVRDHSQR